ncbi:MAG: hypothetical protein JSW50_07785 [Candidatus Latescibacterota bacterium]|nr:MAG: hypothetical protein JSW50_07785 [Candidatus Latescibacterota bacterium]
MIENRKLLIPLSVICLGLSVLFQRPGTDAIPKVNFLQGLLLGISLGISVLALILEAVVRHYE